MGAISNATEQESIKHIEDGCRYRGLDLVDEKDDYNDYDNHDEAIQEACANITCNDKSCVKSIEALKKLIQDQAAQITELQEKLHKTTTGYQEEDSGVENSTKKRKRGGTIGSLMNVAMFADAGDIKISRYRT